MFGFFNPGLQEIVLSSDMICGGCAAPSLHNFSSSTSLTKLATTAHHQVLSKVSGPHALGIHEVGASI